MISIGSISLCHNGEINTLRGNISRMRALKLMKSDVFGEDIKIFPIILKENQIQLQWIW
jgi:glutamate synthase domain-containing protein 1